VLPSRPDSHFASDGFWSANNSRLSIAHVQSANGLDRPRVNLLRSQRTCPAAGAPIYIGVPNVSREWKNYGCGDDRSLGRKIVVVAAMMHPINPAVG
jgi:hypothetical protein